VAVSLPLTSATLSLVIPVIVVPTLVMLTTSSAVTWSMKVL